MPRFLEARLRGRRGLADSDWAAISAVVRSGTGAGRDPLFIATRSPFISKGGRCGRPWCLVDTLSGTGYVSLLAAVPFGGGTVSTGGVAQMGERVNGIHEVRGSIPLASTSPFGRARPCSNRSLRRGGSGARILTVSRE